MAYDLSKRLVIGLASSALFDLKESDEVFRTKGEAEYRKYQLHHENTSLEPGVAFPFIKRLLSLNEISPNDPLVEVILLSRNDPDTGLRVMNSIEKHGLNMTRAVFLQGKSPYEYIPALSIDLFLSANEIDVNNAVAQNYPAGQVLQTQFEDDPNDKELRIAFDFDGVIIDDEAEKVYEESKLRGFHEYENANANIPHKPGLLKKLLEKIAYIQKFEKNQQEKQREKGQKYEPILRIAIVTARNAPSHKRPIYTLRDWGISVNEAFFLGGIEKAKVLEVLNPHIFFDDQKIHLEPAASKLPAVHIPFGVKNQQQNAV